MSERVVICFRWRGATARIEGYLPAAESLTKRVAAYGGRLVAWHARTFAISFPGEAIQDAIDLVAEQPLPPRFAAGVATGEIRSVAGGDSRVGLGWGPPLVRAAALSRIARDGEVLLDPAMEAVKQEQVLTRGSRLGMYGNERVRGAKLDLDYPWRDGVADSVSRMVRPRRVGASLPGSIKIAPWTLSVVRAAPGMGGSRLLSDLAGERAGILLRLGPHAAGEPLGALRLALLGAQGLFGPEVVLHDAQAVSLESLLAGEGLDAETAGALVGAWCAQAEGSGGGLVLLDDAPGIDADSLEAVAHACEAGLVAVVAHLRPGEVLPAALGRLPIATEIQLTALKESEASVVARHSVAGMLEARAAARWGHRGGGSPLAVMEAVAEGLEGGELIWRDSGVVPRTRSAGRGRPQSASHWIRRRWRFLSEDARGVLAVLAVLGGQAEVAEVAELCDALNLQMDVEGLIRVRWLTPNGEALLSLPSRTHSDVIMELTPSLQLRRYQLLASEYLENSERPLAMASAALLAALAGNSDRAEELARKASFSARAAGLEDTAVAFEQFAESGERQPLVERQLIAPWLDEEPQSVPPVSLRTSMARAPAIPPPPGISTLGEIGSEAEDRAAGKASAALKSGDFTAMESAVQKLREDSDHTELAERLTAMVALVRGESGQALRLLRLAKERSLKGSASDRCRAALALGVGLAAAGRPTDALLEGLEGLARAREADDVRGQRACLRFLAQLSRSAGQEAAASRWQSILDAQA